MLFQAASGLCKKSTISTEDKNQQRLLSAIQNNKPEEVISLAENGTNIALRTNLGDTLLHLSVICESVGVVEALISLGLHPNRPNDKGVSPMWTAVEVGNSTVMDVLKENGASIKVRSGLFNDSLIHYTSRKGNDDALKWLLNNGAYVDDRNNKKQTPLLIATENGYQILVQMLLSAGANVNCRYNLGETPLHIAAGNGHLAVVRALLKHGANVNALSLLGITPLHKAAEGGFDMVIRELISNDARSGVSNTVLGLAPLHMAAYSLNSAKALIENGADVNVSTFNGAKPIHWVGNGYSTDQSDVVDVLVENGAYVNDLMLNGWTPLHLATLRASAELVTKLVEIGADINARDWYGRTPLHYMVVRNNPNLIDLLIDNGATISDEDDDHETPLSWAKNRGLNDVVNRLEYWKSIITNQ